MSRYIAFRTEFLASEKGRLPGFVPLDREDRLNPTTSQSSVAEVITKLDLKLQRHCSDAKKRTLFVDRPTKGWGMK